MLKIIGVRFKSVGKVYYFDPQGKDVKQGDKVIVETARGVECGEVAVADREIDESTFNNPIKPIIRIATDDDMKRIERNKAKEKEAFRICEAKIAAHKLNMNLIDVECTFDNNKLLFYFTAENRVDFRELVKDLAAVFKTRIELRQIGVRDEARMLGGIGICGRPLCCSKWLNDFHPVSIKMAKQQNLSLNPSKISGSCGRLMCCLNFEDKTYKELRKGMPKDNERVETPGGLAKVVKVDYFNGRINTRAIERDPETGEEVFAQEIKSYTKDEIKRKSRNAKNEKVNGSQLDDEPDETDDIPENIDADEARELEALMKED